MTLRHRGGSLPLSTAGWLCGLWASAHALAAPIQPAVIQSPQAAATAPTASLEDQDPDIREAISLHQQARVAIQQQQWSEAELLLERVLMLHPAHAEAMIDLAQLLAQRGRETAALAILDVLRADPRTPILQRHRLSELVAAIQRRIDQSAQASSQPRATNLAGSPRPQSASIQWGELALGYSRNPLLSTSNSFITLTLPDGNFQLPLETRPRPAAHLAAVWGWRSAQGQEVSVQAQQFDGLGSTPTWRAAWHVPWWRRSPMSRAGQHPPNEAQGLTAAGAASLAISVGTVARVQQFTDGSRRLNAAVDVRLNRWGLEFGAYEEAQRQRAGAVARLSRSFAGEAEGRWQATAWLDAEQNQREGPPGFQGVGLTGHWRAMPRWTLQATVTAQNDTRGYSALLENNSARRIVSMHMATEWTIGSAANSGFWILRSYHARRHSNISLFEGRDTGVQVIWRYMR